VNTRVNLENLGFGSKIILKLCLSSCSRRQETASSEHGSNHSGLETCGEFYSLVRRNLFHGVS